MSDQPTYRLGAAQVAEAYLDREATIDKDCEYIYRAGEKDVDLLVFPEFHVPASPHYWRFDDEYSLEEYYQRLFEEAVTVPSPATDRLCEAAAEAGVVVVIGINEKESDTAGTMHNSLVFIDADGTLCGVRRKLVPTKQERLFHTGGDGSDMRTFETSLGTISGLMCGEHTNHLAGYTLLAEGEELHAAAWPAFPWYDRETRKRRIGIRTRFHAFAGNVPTIMATGVVTEELAEAVGKPDWGSDSGTSAIVSPEGEYLAGPRWEDEGIIYADVDMGSRIRSKTAHDITGHYNRFDVFDLRVDRSKHEPLTIEKEADD